MMKKIFKIQRGRVVFFSGILLFGSLYGLWSFDFVSNGPKEIQFENEELALVAAAIDMQDYNEKSETLGRLIKTSGFSNSIWGDYKKGYIIIEKVHYKDLKKDDFVVYKTPKKLINHRLRTKTKKGWIAEGDGNRRHDSILVTKDNLVGRVLNKTFYRY